jgi:hypothetical protein
MPWCVTKGTQHLCRAVIRFKEFGLSQVTERTHPSLASGSTIAVTSLFWVNRR